MDLKNSLILPHPLTNFEIQKCYQNEPKLHGLYSRDNLLEKMKDGVYVINLEEYFDTGPHWTALYALNNDVTYFDSFGVEYIRKKVKKFLEGSAIKASTITTNIYRFQVYDSVMCKYFCVGFIDFILKGKSLIDFNNLFSTNNFKKWWYDFKLF